MELTSRAARRHLTEEFGTRVYGGTDQVQIHSAKLMLGFLAVVCNSRGIQASVIGLYISFDEQFDGPAFVVTADSDVIFCLDSDLRITSCNPGWDRFAVDNGAPGLCGPALIGRSILDCMTEPDRAYYALAFGRVLAQAQPWEHLYECSSAVLYRQFRSQLLPLAGRAGLMVINCLQVQHAHERVQFRPAAERDWDNRRQIKMCCGCRRTRQCAPGEENWEWVPHFVETMPPDVTHGICPSCLKHYYPDEG